MTVAEGRAQHRVIDGHEEAVRSELAIGEQIRRAQRDVGGNARRAQALRELECVLPAHHSRESRLERVALPDPRCERAQGRLGEVRERRQRAQRVPLRAALDRDRDEALDARARVDTVWTGVERRMTRAPRNAAARGAVEQQRLDEVDPGLDLREIDVLAAARARPVVERRSERRQAVALRDEVRVRAPGTHGLPVRPAGQAGDARREPRRACRSPCSSAPDRSHRAARSTA